jgi:osmoprotectant transport system permease protein
VSGSLQQMWDYLGTRGAWHGRNGLPSLTWAHIQLSVGAVLISAVIAVPIAVVLGHFNRGGIVATSIVNIGRAIPSYAIMALIFPFALRYGFGLGFWPTMVALVLLAVPPIFTNTFTGIRDVPEPTREAARGMGMRGGELLRKVEVPVAMPLILTGIRVSAVQVVATATLGALVGYRDLGTVVITGYTSSNKGPMLAGAIAVAALALLTDVMFALAERWLIAWRRPVGRTADATVTAEEAAPVAAAA